MILRDLEFLLLVLLSIVLCCQPFPSIISYENNYIPCTLIPPGTLKCTDLQLSEVPIFKKTDLAIRLVDLSQNYFKIIPDNAFVNFSQTLTGLRIWENSVNMAISSGAFNNLPHLKSLELGQLTNSKILNLDPSQFTSPLSVLNILILEGLDVRKITSLDLPNLTTLKLSKLSLTEITPTAFNALPNLKNFTLREVSTNIFSNMALWLKPLSALTLLDLSNNNLGSLNNIVFPVAPFSLTSLVLKQCNFEEGKPTISFNALKDTLVNLDLSENSITTNIAFSLLQQLHTLTIHQAQFTRLPGFIKNLPLLEKLIISSDNFNEIKKGNFRENSLIRFLFLSSKQSIYIDTDAFAALSRLESIFLNFNNNVHFNQRGSWPIFFSNFPILKLLKMRGMQINEDFFNDINVISSLTSLSLSQNKIETVPEVLFEKFPLLTSLDISNNLVKLFPFTALLKTKVKSINLSNNKLTTLDNCLLGPNPLQFGIELKGNLFFCDCRIAWMRTDKYQSMSSGITCAANGPHSSLLLSSLNSDMLVCSSGEKVKPCTPISTVSPSPEIPINVTFFMKVHDKESMEITVLGLMLYASRYPNFYFRFTDQSGGASETPSQSSKVTRNVRVFIKPGVKYTFCLILLTPNAVHIQTKCDIFSVAANLPPIAKGSLTSTEIGLIVAGSILVLISAIGITIYLIKRRERRKEKKAAEYAYQVAQSYDPDYQGVYPDPYAAQPGNRSTMMSNGRMIYQMGSNHSLAQSQLSLAQMGNSQPQQYFVEDSGHPNSDGGGMYATNPNRIAKYRSRSMDMLDAPKLRANQRAFRRPHAGSTNDLLRASNASIASNRMPLSTSLSYLNSGIVPPSMPGPLPDVPNESCYEEIPDLPPEEDTYLPMKRKSNNSTYMSMVTTPTKSTEPKFSGSSGENGSNIAPTQQPREESGFYC